MTTLLVATTGGHLADLHELADRLASSRRERLWVTFPGPQSRSLLQGERTILIPPVGERDVVGVMRGAWWAHRVLRRHRIRAVISTGSAVALSFLPCAAAHGVAAHYIECSARVGAPSLTGRLLERCPGVRVYMQYPNAARGRWRYCGSVYEGFGTRELGSRPVRKVAVTLGTMQQSFRRLLERLLAILPSGMETVWQTGHTPTDGLGISAHRFLSPAELDRAIREADVVVAHGGCGSALGALKAGKLPILVPRDPTLGEVVDGHQPELVSWLDARGLALGRRPGELTFADLEHAAAHEVIRLTAPPPLRLSGD
jgi:UDP-N-acetylglucosamine--N-acetylmuramyl-(pentapeptide) pyrophosphoryl-undecaprenol N-acetylglucosamine transferase